MSAQFDGGKYLPGADSTGKENLTKQEPEIRKHTDDPKSTDAIAEPPFQFGEWIEGNVG
ncbi:hypothetical protein ACO0LO_24865 [Undibacterium sp. TJN25]|uniref:hypothetical protein n=1 Tax=Undibacterium sp. TJN25 TaxID=3413056 RepID=UPI003BF19BB3